MSQRYTITERIQLAWHALTSPAEVAVFTVRFTQGDEPEQQVSGIEAVHFLQCRLDGANHALREIPEMIHAAYSEGYKTGVHDWAEGKCVPSEKADEYLERNRSYVGRRIQEVYDGEA